MLTFTLVIALIKGSAFYLVFGEYFNANLLQSIGYAYVIDFIAGQFHNSYLLSKDKDLMKRYLVAERIVYIMTCSLVLFAIWLVV